MVKTTLSKNWPSNLYIYIFYPVHLSVTTCDLTPQRKTKGPATGLWCTTSMMACTDPSTAFFMTMLTVCQFCTRYVKRYSFHFTPFIISSFNLFSSSCNRSQSQMKRCTPAASGAQRATVLTALSSSAACLNCRWATGWCLRTWGPTLWQPPPPSTASRDPTSTTSCHAMPGESVSEAQSVLVKLMRENFYRFKWTIFFYCLYFMFSQATRGADLFPGHAGSCRGVVPVWSACLLWQREQLGSAQ